jgi:hypothetical protein
MLPDARMWAENHAERHLTARQRVGVGECAQLPLV